MNLPLRWRLPIIATAILLVAEMLLTIAAIGIVRHSLTTQIDARLTDAATQLAARSGQMSGETMGMRAANSLPSDYVVQFYGPAGRALDAINAQLNDTGTPDLGTPSPQGVPTTIVADASPWRAVNLPLRNGRGSVTVALPLDDVAAAAATLRRTLGLVALATVVVGGAAAWWATRRSLRPLSEVEEVAGRIAAGDLSQRVPGEDATTEVGSVAVSLNRMLEQLQTAFEAQRASDARLRQFVSDASHELRTPLTAIRGYAELHGSGVGADADDAMRRIESNAIRMGALVEDLLALARSDEAAQTLAGTEPVDMRAVCEGAAADARAQDPTRTITVSGDPTAVVVGSDRHLRQVVDNLVGNALQHTDPGTAVDLDVRTGRDAVVTTVRDHGPGIAAEERERVFERFHRLDPSRARTTGGAGLGLSIVAAIVAAHRGTVAAVQPDGPGVAMVVTLPTHAAATVA